MRNYMYFLFFIYALNCIFISNTNGRPAIKEEQTLEERERGNPRQRAARDGSRGQQGAVPPPINKFNDNEVRIENAITTPVAELLSYLPTEENYYKIFKTFTNSNKNLATIMKALAVYERNKNLGTGNGGNIAETIENIAEGGDEGDESEYAEAAKDKYAGNVYLKSILFISSNYWTVWINDAKISSESNEEENNEFFVKGISKDEVTLTRRLSRGKWRYINSGNYVSADRYKINEETSQVELTLVLHPNQTFVIAKNEIIDGKLKREVLRVDDIESIGGASGGDDLSTPNEEINFDDLLNDL
jgi:hypothetical protein